MSPRQRLAAVRLALEAEARTHVRFEGHSMWPTLWPGDTLAVTAIAGDLRRGDIVLFLAGDRLLCHRIVGYTPEGRWRTRGDSMRREDPPVAPGEVVAKVESVARAPCSRAAGALRGLLDAAWTRAAGVGPGPAGAARWAAHAGARLLDWRARRRTQDP